MSLIAAVMALMVSGEPIVTPAAPGSHRVFSGLTLSPSGDRLAVIEADDKDDAVDEPHRRVVIRTAAGAIERTYDPCATCIYQDPTFSPDGRTIAFLGRDRKAGTTLLYLASGDDVALKTTIKGVAERPRFSPDGATLAVLVIEGAHKEVGATQAAAPQVGEIGENVDEKRIAVMPAKGAGDLRLVSPGDTFVYEYDWTPDAKGFVVTAAKGDGDNNWWVADLDHVDLAGGALRRVTKPTGQLNMPRVSPDGRQVAYIGGLMSDFGPVGGDVFLAPIGGGAPVDITPGFKGSFTGLTWRGGRIIATALINDKAAIVAVDPSNGHTKTLWSAPLSVEAGDGRISLNQRGDRIAAVVQDFEHPTEIAVGNLASFGLGARVTHENSALVPAGGARSVEWTSEGRTVQGWLLSPAGLAPDKTYPMVVLVHGGPSSAVTPNFPASGFRGGTIRKLLEKGYFVFMPNPRGSYGQGEAFTRANIRDFGGGDLRDILAGVDAVEKIAPVDDQRLGIYGHSYGGFMSMWAVTNSHRFHAAVAGAGIANWISYYGENGIDQWMIPFFGASAYDDPAIYEKLSPLTTIKTATTPTFIYVGERDVECPAPQSVEFWHGLKEAGVPTKLLILAGEGHGIRKPDHLKQLSDAELGWFDTYLGAGGRGH
jgi:dipeptidyl aminopeptidase/acylaminoacyl peptidase